MTDSPTLLRILQFSLADLAKVSPLLILLALVTGCAETPEQYETGPAPVPVPTQPLPTGIQPGEKLAVYVMEDDTFSGTYTVSSTGAIIVPKLGRVMLGSMSAQAAENVLARELEKNTLTKATVLVDRTSLSKKTGQPSGTTGTDVFLSGKVSRPGRYTLMAVGNTPPTVHHAILQAGGCSRFAHKKKAHVLRRSSDGKLYRINADLVAIESGAMRDVPLASGDIVVIPEKKVDFGL